MKTNPILERALNKLKTIRIEIDTLISIKTTELKNLNEQYINETNVIQNLKQEIKTLENLQKIILN